MTKEELDIQKEIEKYFTESTGFGRDKLRKFMDIVNKALKQKGVRIEELETRCTELFLQNNEFAERFEKSIEIIKGLLSCCRNYPQENAEKMEQAEQFIKEIKE